MVIKVEYVASSSHVRLKFTVLNVLTTVHTSSRVLCLTFPYSLQVKTGLCFSIYISNSLSGAFPSVRVMWHANFSFPLQPTWTFFRRWRWSTRNSRGGRVTPRHAGSGTTCHPRPRITFALWKTTLAFPVSHSTGENSICNFHPSKLM